MVDHMKLMKKTLKLSKNQKKILAFILITGLIIGYILYKKISPAMLDDITNIKSNLENNPLNFIGLHIITLALILASSFFFIGPILFLLYFIWEVACISFSLFIFSSAFQFQGFLYGLLYNILTKLLFIICLIFLFQKITTIIKSILHKEPLDINILKKEYRHILMAIITIILYDILLYFLGNTILLKLCFL